MFDIDWLTLDFTCDICIVKPMCKRHDCEILLKSRHDIYFLDNIKIGFRKSNISHTTFLENSLLGKLTKGPVA